MGFIRLREMSEGCAKRGGIHRLQVGKTGDKSRCKHSVTNIHEDLIYSFNSNYNAIFKKKTNSNLNLDSL